MLVVDAGRQGRPLEHGSAQVATQLLDRLVHAHSRRPPAIRCRLAVAPADSVEEWPERTEPAQITLDRRGVDQRRRRDGHERLALGRAVTIGRGVGLPAPLLEVGAISAGQRYQHLPVGRVVFVEGRGVEARCRLLDGRDPPSVSGGRRAARIGHLVVEAGDTQHGGVEGVDRVPEGEEILAQPGEFGMRPPYGDHAQIARSARRMLPPITARISSSLKPCCTSHRQMLAKFSVGFSSPST